MILVPWGLALLIFSKRLLATAAMEEARRCAEKDFQG